MGDPLGPKLSFFASPVNAYRFFLLFFDCLTIGYASFGEKNDIGRAIFTLISMNGHYCAMSQDIGRHLQTKYLFLKFHFKNVNVFMFFNFQQNFVEKFIWESGFSNFDHATLRTKICILAAILKQIFFWFFLLLIYGCFGCVHIWYKFCAKIPEGKYFSGGPTEPPLCTNRSEK